MWLLNIFFSLLCHLLKLLWNICLKLKDFELSLSLIKVFSLVFTTSAFIRVTSSEASPGDTYVLMNDLLFFFFCLKLWQNYTFYSAGFI